MKKVTFFAAAVAVSALVAAPALAQDSMQPRASVQGKAHTSKHMSMHKHQHMRHHSARHDRMTSRDNWDRRDTGFWPGAVAGGIVGGAIGTAGAIATAPFGGPSRDYAYRDSYAYGPMGYDVGYKYDGIAMPQSSNYAARNGFVCQPGTVTRPANGSGIPLICQ